MGSTTKFYVTWSTNSYEQNEDTFEHEAEMMRWLNERADYPEFKFRVVCGYEVAFEPVEVVKQYRRK